MKIVFVIGQLSNGGAERVVSLLSSCFANDNEVEIITLISSENVYNTAEAVLIKHIESKTNNKILRIINRFVGLKKEIKRFNPDIIISFTTEINIYSVIANLSYRKPLIISERNDPYNDPPSKITRKIRDFVYKWASGYVFQTEDAKAYFSKLITGKQVVIPNPVKDGLPNALAEQKEKKIVTVSRLYPQKNIKCLIEAFYELSNIYPDYNLEIFGDGPLKNELIEIVARLKLNDKVIFHGFCTNVHEQIKTAEMFVLASDYEGMSNAMIEALAMGLPTICTDCPIGGARMLIQNNINGILVPVNNKEELCKAMVKLLDDKELRYKMASEALLLRETLSTQLISEQWRSFVKEVLSEKDTI